jgi:chromosome segregation ATPase
MSRLDVAAERFAAALAMLEEKAAPLARLRDELGRANAKLAELSAEREKLLARIAELEGERKSLAGLTEEVEGRLDTAIAEIRAALGQ